MMPPGNVRGNGVPECPHSRGGTCVLCAAALKMSGRAIWSKTNTSVSASLYKSVKVFLSLEIDLQI